MKMSKRLETLNGREGDGWSVFNRSREMIAAGVDVTELTIGEHDIRTAAPILQAMHESALGGHTGYAAVPGTRALREVVARRCTERTGVPTGPENVLITPGGQAALFAAHMAVCDPGDRALYLDPYYATYPGTLRAVGTVPVRVETEAARAFQPAEADLMAAAHGARSILINSPNNPTGTVYHRETLEGIARVCQAEQLWLISDEVYDTQIWEGAHISPRALPGMDQRTLVIGSMSKSHAMTGSRCGWVIGPEDIIAHLVDLATATTYGVPGFVQDASVFALEQGAEFEAAVAEPFRRRRALAQEVLERQNIVSAVPCQGAMYLMLDVRAAGMSGEDFANALLDSHQIAVMPGESFGRSAAGHIRVAMTIDDTRFAEALGTLLAFAAAQQLSHA